MTVALQGMTSEAEYAGEVRARIESRLGFRVAGKLVKRQAEIGQRVKPGQVLAQLDPQDYRLAVEATRSRLLVATTNRDLARAKYKRFRDFEGPELRRRGEAGPTRGKLEGGNRPGGACSGAVDGPG